MFESLSALPADPLLGLIVQYKNDTNPQKIDLGVGVYRDEQGLTPVLDSVKEAEAHILNSEESKAYVGPAGNTAYSAAMAELVFGQQHSEIAQRLVSLQTPGGCGALRVLAETISKAKPQARLWVSDPTWANHVPLLGGAGLEITTYPYYDFDKNGLRFDEMLTALSQAKRGDLVLLHGCCHNPSGADLNEQQWQAVIALCKQNGLVAFIDVAYQGFGVSLEHDAYGVRLAAKELPEVLVAVSCSKNFGLYRERVGCAFVVTDSADQAQVVASHMMAITRGIYSMPPSHGATVVATILQSIELREQWDNDLTAMRNRIQQVRESLQLGLAESTQSSRFDFITRETGMFSFLGLNADQVARLASEHAIYMADSSRINIAGVNDRNLNYLVAAVKSVL